MPRATMACYNLEEMPKNRRKLPPPRMIWRIIPRLLKLSNFCSHKKVTLEEFLHKSSVSPTKNIVPPSKVYIVPPKDKDQPCKAV